MSDKAPSTTPNQTSPINIPEKNQVRAKSRFPKDEHIPENIIEKEKSVPFTTRMKMFLYNHFIIQFLNLRYKNKLFGCLFDKFDKLSPRARKAAICLVVLWKLFTTSLTIYLVVYGRSQYLKKQNMGKQVVVEESFSMEQEKQFRILHIITSLAEYNSGLRGTTHGQDRLQEVLIPCMKGAVNSILQEPNWTVDVHLILGFNLSPTRRQLVRNALPPEVDLEVWNDATPFSYERSRSDGKIKLITRGLARQHRYVLLDKLDHYDFFTVFEDDMRITSSHIKAYVELSDKINVLKSNAPKGSKDDKRDTSLFGPMTVTQLERVIPGFFRVEVMLDGSQSQSQPEPIPIDLDFEGKKETINPDYCCAVSKEEQHKVLLPTNPKPNQIMTWETTIGSFSLRKFDDPLGWAALLPGRKKLKSGEIIGSYWSGEDGSLGKRLGAGDGKLFGQQGGFMASREQILDFDRLCQGEGFLPPFDEPFFPDEGLHMKNVEFWSGGYQLFGGGIGGCNIQRIVPIDPDGFSKFLLYHTANNKQIQIPRSRRLLVENLLGQINTVKKKADKKLASQK